MIAEKYRVGRNQIPYILKKGGTKKSKLFIVKYTKSRDKISKFCTIVSKKISTSAVERNQLKRRIYESVRLILKKEAPKEHFNIILIPKKSVKEATYQEIENDIRKIITNGQIQ